MMRKVMAVLVALVMTGILAACGAGEESTLTGMIVSREGTKISLMEMDTANMSGMNFGKGGNFELPEGMEGFQGFGDFNMEDFAGMMPGNGSFPQWGSGEMPQMPEGMPGNGEMPSFGGNMPNFGGGMPSFGGGNGGMGSGFENFASDVETKELDIGDAHISVEIENGKESGSLEDLTPGAFVTITVNGRGKVTYVLISSRGFFGNS